MEQEVVYKTNWYQWAKMSVFAYGAWGIGGHLYSFIGSMLIYYKVVDSLPMVELFTY